MAALDAQGFDVGTDGFGDSQPVERQQRDQRMLVRLPKADRHQQRAELVTIQAYRLVRA